MEVMGQASDIPGLNVALQAQWGHRAPYQLGVMGVLIRELWADKVGELANQKLSLPVPHLLLATVQPVPGKGGGPGNPVPPAPQVLSMVARIRHSRPDKTVPSNVEGS